MTHLTLSILILLGSVAWGQTTTGNTPTTMVLNPPCMTLDGFIYQSSANQVRPAGTPLPGCVYTAAINTTTLAPRDSDGSTDSGDGSEHSPEVITAEKSVECSETGRVKLSGVQDHADKAQIVGGRKPEPMDVPAIQTTTSQDWDIATDGELMPFASLCHLTSGVMTFAPDPIACHHSRYTCSDKSRVLLTDEGGGKHCILFPKEKP